MAKEDHPNHVHIAFKRIHRHVDSQCPPEEEGGGHFHNQWSLINDNCATVGRIPVTPSFSYFGVPFFGSSLNASSSVFAALEAPSESMRMTAEMEVGLRWKKGQGLR